MEEEDRYIVYWGDLPVLEMSNQPGLLISGSAPPPPPGSSLTRHPFLSATALVAEHEHTLREALDRSTSLEEYIRELEALGYRVELAPE
jgi:hypothetical protein